MISTRTAPPHKFPLRTTLVLPFVLQLVAAVGLVGYLSFRNGQQAVNDLANQLQREIGSRVSDRVQVYLEAPHLVNQINEDAARLGALDFNDLESSRSYLWKQVLRFKSIGHVGLANEKGQYLRVGWVNRWVGSEKPQLAAQLKPGSGDLIYYKLDENGNPLGVAKTTPNYNVRQRPLYKAVLKNNRAAWSDVYINFGYGSLQINASAPYYDAQNNLVGVFTCQMGLDQIRRFLQTLQIGKSGQVFLMEPSGELIATSLANQPLTIGKGEAQKRLSAQESSDLVMRQSMAHLQTHLKDLDSIQKATRLDFQIDGQRQFLEVSSLRDQYGLNWLIVVVVPEADFMAQINANTRNTVLLCLGALGLAIAIGILTSRWVTRPILRVSQASNELAQGELHQQVEPSPITEINTLANSFNGMAGQLKESFAALQQSEAHHKALLNAIPDLMVEVSRDGIYLNVIEAKDGKWLAIDRKNQVGQSVNEVLPAQIALQYQQAVEQVLQDGKVLTVEYESQVDNETHTFEARVAACRENSALFLIRNISDRKQAEAALKQSEATNRALIDAIPDLLLRVSRDGTYLDNAVGANRLKAFSGGTPSLAKTTVQDSLPPEQAQQRMATIEQALQTGNLQVYEHRLVINGQPIDEEVRVIVTGEDEVLVMVRDISDRKRAEEALRIAEETYRSIFENALEGIFQSSPKGRFINVNPAMAKIYGYDSPQEMINTITDISVQIYVDPEDQIEFQRQLEANDQVKDFEYRVYQKDNEIIWIQEETRAVRDNAGQLLYYEGMIQDITERKRREDELRRQLEELKIEIDQQKRKKEVAVLTESAYFQEVQQEIAEVNLDEFWS